MAGATDGRTTRWAHRRAELLTQVVECMCRVGLADLSIRGISRQVGVSAPALLHHFGSKENLVTEALISVQRDELAALKDALAGKPLSQGLQSLWQLHASHGNRDRLRAVFEFQAIALREPARFPSFHQNVTRPWVEAFHQALELSGCPSDERIALATMLSGTYRGLLTDLLATGENQRVGQGFRALLGLVDERQGRWRSDAT